MRHLFLKKIVLISLIAYGWAQGFTQQLLYTTLTITEPRILQIISTQAFQRLKHITQYGIDPVVLPAIAHTKEYSRYLHSLGVYWLLHRYGASFEEQVAGLLHDASHTVFSHVGDLVFDHEDGHSSYQDDHHIEFLQETDLPPVLEQIGLALEQIDHKAGVFACLEQDLPDICADRLEYNLSGGILENLITPQEACKILEHLKFEDGRWYFIDPYWAEKFARISLWHTENRWGAPLSAAVSHALARALRTALRERIITLHEVKHGTDKAVWEKLCTCSHPEIRAQIEQVKQTAERSDEITKTPRKNKFRGINPWVLQEGSLKRLTEVNPDFKSDYERVEATGQKNN